MMQIYCFLVIMIAQQHLISFFNFILYTHLPVHQHWQQPVAEDEEVVVFKH